MVIELDGKSRNADWTKITQYPRATRHGPVQFLAGKKLTSLPQGGPAVCCGPALLMAGPLVPQRAGHPATASRAPTS
jgi:hypothetical protein